jgi:hypothetical protein
MNPILDLSLLLRSMEPVLNPGVFAFCSIRPGQQIDPTICVASIRETEGLSVVLSEEDAVNNNLDVLFRCAWITLNVSSDLHAVGLTAAFSDALGKAGISCNVVAGAHHDHIFVPVQMAEQAINTLRRLQNSVNSGDIRQR